jgi:hypothetical protein
MSARAGLIAKTAIVSGPPARTRAAGDSGTAILYPAEPRGSGAQSGPGSNVVGVCVRRLRTKLGDHLIASIRGEGYQLGVG